MIGQLKLVSLSIGRREEKMLTNEFADNLLIKYQ